MRICRNEKDQHTTSRPERPAAQEDRQAARATVSTSQCDYLRCLLCQCKGEAASGIVGRAQAAALPPWELALIATNARSRRR